MTSAIKRIVYMLIGLFAGLTAFSVLEFFNRAGFSSFLLLSIMQGAVLGFIYGFAFGFTDAVFYHELKSGTVKAITAAAVGAAVAAASQLLTAQGLLLSSNLVQRTHSSVNLLLPLWRGLGWMLMGAAIGSIDGIYRRTLKRTAAGALGGLTGGLSGGLGYEFLIRLFPNAVYSALTGLILMGVLTGLFIFEFERRFSFGRLRVLNGPLKDREFLLIRRKTTVGDQLTRDVYLHGYGRVSEGRLIRTGGLVYFVDDGNKIAGASHPDVTLLNDEPLSQRRELKYHDVIGLGSVKLLYLPS